jgi:hypothetical protein
MGFKKRRRWKVKGKKGEKDSKQQDLKDIHRLKRKRKNCEVKMIYWYSKIKERAGTG